jgi:CelD/BcsL family acetyltransferase involved in cellulose biosynthesis
LGVRIAEPAATGSPGYFGVMVDPACPGAAARLAEACADGRLFHALGIEDFSSLDAATEEFLGELSRRGFSVARAHRNPCRRIALGRTYDQYLLDTKSKKSRANLRREEKKLREAAAVELVDLAGPAVTDEALRRVAAIQDASWMKGRGAAVLGEPAYQRLLRSVADAGILRVWIVTVGGEDAAFVVGLLLHGQMHYCWTAFRLQFEPLSVGKVLTGWTVRDACAAGAQSFDFGQGDGEYKRFWATDAHDVHRVVAGRGLGGTVVVLFRRAAWRLARVDWIKARYRAVRRWLKGRRGAAPPAPEAAGEPGSAGDDPPAER